MKAHTCIEHGRLAREGQRWKLWGPVRDGFIARDPDCHPSLIGEAAQCPRR